MRRLFASTFFLTTALPAFAAGGEAEGGFPPFNAATFAGQLFWLAVTFGTLYYLMSRVALPRVGAIIAEREATIESALSQASKAQAAAETEAQALELALAKGAHVVSTDNPVQKPRDPGLQVQLPGGRPSRCNPLTAPELCTSDAVNAGVGGVVAGGLQLP